MSKEIRIPLTEIKVKYRAGSRRPITELDRLVMKAIAVGATSVTELKQLFHLPERLLVECLVDLMDMALLALGMSGNGFQLTEFGTQVLKQGLSEFGEWVDEEQELSFLREELTGMLVPGSAFRYDHEQGTIRPQPTGSIPRGDIEDLLVKEIKRNSSGSRKYLHSIESIVPVRKDISCKVTVSKDSVYGLPSYWQDLESLLRQRTGILGEQPRRGFDQDQGDEGYWTDVCLDQDALLLTVQEHETALFKAIAQSHKHLLIISAHVSEEMLNKLKEPIGTAMQRGVCIDVLFGFASLEGSNNSHAKALSNWSSEIKKKFQSDNLNIHKNSLDSDAKILVWDTPDGTFHWIVGSYNWLHGFEGAQGVGVEISVRLNHPRLLAWICRTISGWLDDKGKGSNSDGISRRWAEIGRTLRARIPSEEGKPNSLALKARVLCGKKHDFALGEGLSQAEQRLLITSHKINSSATGSIDARDVWEQNGTLHLLTNRKTNADFQCVLVTGKKPAPDNWNEEDQERLEKSIGSVNGSLRIGTGTHARVLVYDKTTVISSYNFLSSSRSAQQIGIMLKEKNDSPIADALWKTFLGQ